MATDSITCPRCLHTSYNPNDVREGYCGYCHDWTGGNAVRPSAASAEVDRLGRSPLPVSRVSASPAPAPVADRTVRGRVAEVHVTVVLEELDPRTGERIFSEYRSVGQPMDDYARVLLEPHHDATGVPDYVRVKIDTNLLPIAGLPLHVADQPHQRRAPMPEPVVIRESDNP